MYRKILLLLVVMAMAPVRAQLPGVLRWDTGHDLDVTYEKVYKSLEESNFFVVFEPNIGRNLAGFAERWGENYNRNELAGIRAMVFCNAWYANAVSNLEPVLLSICPLHITLFRHGATTSIVFTRPTHTGTGSAAMSLLQELEADVSKAIQAGIEAAGRAQADGGPGD
jgi:hypothetical protein